jgi:hypothetical protein
MKLYRLLLLTFFIIIFACSSSTDSGEKLNFEDLNIEYIKSGGWINHYILSIDSSGFVEALVRFHSTWEVSDSNTTVLTQSEKKILSNLFESFKGMKDYYEPDHYITDQNYHTIILRSQAESDTTSVYDPLHCNLPYELDQIISFMENKIDELLN